MTSIVAYLTLHFIFCTLFFVLVQRPVFIIANRHTAKTGITAVHSIAVTRKGLKLDLAAAAYLTGIPLLVLWIAALVQDFPVKAALCIADAVVALVMSVVTVADTVLYGPWRFRIDCSVLAYLRSPQGAFASVSSMYVIGGIAGILVFAAVLFAAMFGIASFTDVFSLHIHVGWAAASGVMLLCAAVTFAFIRGLRHRPNSPFMVYHTTDMFLNHAGVNPLFNFIFSLSMRKKESKQFMVFDAEEVDREMKRLIPTEGTPQTRLLVTKRPKTIVFVIWESLCAHFTAALGGKGVTENFDRLCGEGVLFTRVDAGSYRTDPALICTLSGYPGHPTTSIMRNSHALTTLPALPHTLKKHGYNTTVIHGGNLSILHLVDYFLASGHERVVSVDDMPPEAPRCAWGVHDNYMFDYLFDDLQDHASDPGMRYVTFLTLSSHQPYKVPYSKLPDEIDNSYAFTDESFGRFIDRMKQTEMWKDTLVVALGDHGISTTFLPLDRNVQPHIPVLLLGGVVQDPGRKIDTIMAQTDIAATLLGQLGIEHKDFLFSRDVLADTYTEPFSMHSYNNGFLYRDETGYTDFDNVSRKAVEGADERRERRGRMFMQYMMTDLAKR